MFNLFKQAEPHEIQAGDIIGFSGYNAISAIINFGSWGIPFWSISHVGIMAEHGGRLLLFESTTLDTEPCEVTGKPISGSQAHPLEYSLKNYHGAMWHYPLYRTLFDHERLRLNEFLTSTVGRPYDALGAFRSGGAGFSYIESLFRDADLHSLFCSEWCASAHAEIGLFTTDSGSRWSPNHLLRAERRMNILKRPRRLK